MLVLGGHGVLGTMIAEAAGAAGWTAIRSSRLDEADVIVSTVPDEQLVAERMVLGHGGLLINVSATAVSLPLRRRTTVCYG
jgi:hypothetical protein